MIYFSIEETVNFSICLDCNNQAFMDVYGHIFSLQYYTTRLSPEKWEDYFRVNPGIFARYLRIHPTAWSGGPCLRVDVFSCPSKNIQPSFFRSKYICIFENINTIEL